MSGVSRASGGWFISASVSPDALVRDQAEERRLLELHRESLSQRVVEHRIAGRVGEIGEHDRVLVGQRRGTAAVDQRRRRRPRRRRPRRPTATACGAARAPGAVGRCAGDETRRLDDRAAAAAGPRESRARAGSEARDPSPGTCAMMRSSSCGSAGFSRTADAGARFRMPSKITPGLSP